VGVEPVTLPPDHHFLVSNRLKEDFDNGKTYYAFDGRPIRVPESPSERPDGALLRWHNENVFRAAG
jgi:putative restriction endonuclease